MTEPVFWTCYVCGDRRPDARISVASRQEPLAEFDLEWTVNVRYCNDQPGCVAAAPTLELAAFHAAARPRRRDRLRAEGVAILILAVPLLVAACAAGAAYWWLA